VAESQAIAGAALDAAEAGLAQARAAQDAARADVEATEQARVAAAERAAQALAARHEVDAALARLEAEENALAALLETGAPELWPPLIDAVSVEPGFEAALGAALGEDLSAPADDAAPVHWRTLPPYSTPAPLPVGVPPLSRFVRAPEALNRRLGQIGVVADEAEGRALRDQLQQGQRLVSREGALWRWDGYTVSAGATTAAAARLEQRNRLTDVRARLAEARAAAERARAVAEAARGDEAQASETEKTARARAQACDDAWLSARDALADLKARAAEHDSKLAALAATAHSVDADLAEASALATQTEDELAGLADPATARERLAELRAELGRRRAVQLECQSACDNLKRAAEGRRHRLDDIRRELDSWRQRAASAESQQHALMERRAAVDDELRRIADRPTEIAVQRQALLATIETAEAKRQEAADRLAEMEARLQEADRSLRAAEAELASAREERVRAEGLVSQAQQAGQGIAERIAERLDCTPLQLAGIAKLKDDEPPPDIEAVERKVERLHRERETMGPVNLRAEQEAQELNQQMESMQTERADLIKAIEKLRQGIAELNREGRERLLQSFHDVDKHFQQLFVRLFGGGRAHLALVESDDPLEAGLEIMASPPGKRLQVLSLLSGGEQALTALALLFGVFLTNPAPICVLDEVDAPLDDANVDRFCTLLEEMAQSSGTRFLVITHHRMTMARMDRLFGVTMQERGISQLVSVDLQRAEELRATA
jgi:chromosome segregation protein